MLKKLLLVFTACVVNWTTVQGCFCPVRPHLQDIYCVSDFVIKAKVTGVTHEGGLGADVYSITVLKEYEPVPPETELKVYTADSGAACGVFLNVGETYILAGRLSKGKMALHLCESFATLWKHTSRFQRRSLKRTFKKNCNSDNPCGTCAGNCPNILPTKVCQIPLGPQTMCYYEETYCQRKSGICKFKSTKGFRKCLNY